MNLEQFASRGLKAQATADQTIAKHISPVSDVAGVSPNADPGGGASRTAPPLKALNSMPLINRTNVRNFLLEHAKATRPHNKFNRVSEDTLRDIHEAVRQMLIARIHRTPSKGRTM